MAYKISWYYIPISIIIVFLMIVYILYQKLRSVISIESTQFCYINVIPEIEEFPSSAYHHKNAKALYFISRSTTKWCVCKGFEPPFVPKFNMIAAFKMNDKGKYVKNTLFFYSNALNMMIISFAGSKNIEDWITDLDYSSRKPSFTSDERVKAHSGYLSMYEGVRDNIKLVIDDTCDKNTLVVITGHSLGAGLATICFYDFVENNIVKNKLLYSFASPRIGNPEFAEKITATNSSYRITNMEDVITSVPFPVMWDNLYAHIGKMIPFSINLGSVSKNHAKAYSVHFDKDDPENI